ncbi:MAG TPA: hypothetical protein PLZ08_01070 [Bacillota bacterium]|jgi:hypothetical protein|nr:hypothetical protein [Bacillota bacterium]
MICKFCNNSFNNDESACCPHCGNSGSDNIKILTPEERDNFDGITIDNGENQNRDDWYQSTRDGFGRRIYVRRFKTSLSSFGLLQRLLWGLVIAWLIILALPVVTSVLGLLIVGWLLTGFLRRWRRRRLQNRFYRFSSRFSKIF